METTHERVKRRRLNPSSSCPSSSSPSILPEAPHSLSLPLTSALISVHDSSTSSRLPVHEPVSAHVTVPSSQMELALQLQPQQLVAWLGEQNPTDTLNLVHETAAQRYREIKKRKQQELQPKVDQAIASNDKKIVRKQKKKNDNHASAVASRDKNVYIVNQLDKCCRLSMLISAKVGASYTDVKKQLDAATKENEHLKQQLSSVTRCNSASSGSQGSTVDHNTTKSSYTQSDSPPSELNKGPSDDVARTFWWDAFNAPILTSNSMMHERVQRDSFSQSKTFCRSSTISELTALPGDASASESCGISLSNHINTTAPDIFGTLSASADNLEMFLSWSGSCTERGTVLASATFQSIADDHLQKILSRSTGIIQAPPS